MGGVKSGESYSAFPIGGKWGDAHVRHHVRQTDNLKQVKHINDNWLEYMISQSKVEFTANKVQQVEKHGRLWQVFKMTLGLDKNNIHKRLYNSQVFGRLKI